MSNDKVGKPIYPQDIDRVLGKRFFSGTQIASQTNLTPKQKEATISFLLSQGLIDSWLAPKCPACEYTWPICQEEDDIPAKIECPLCNEEFSQKEASFYEIFKMLKDPSNL
jgi:hypothetical protein